MVLIRVSVSLGETTEVFHNTFPNTLFFHLNITTSEQVHSLVACLYMASGQQTGSWIRFLHIQASFLINPKYISRNLTNPSNLTLFGMRSESGEKSSGVVVRKLWDSSLEMDGSSLWDCFPSPEERTLQRRRSLGSFLRQRTEKRQCFFEENGWSKKAPMCSDARSILFHGKIWNRLGHGSFLCWRGNDFKTCPKFDAHEIMFQT